MYQVLDVRKIKTLVGLQNVLGHNSREIISKETVARLNPNWKEDWADIKDLHLLGKKYSQALEDRTKLCENLRRKVNKNASAGFEFVVSADRNLDRSKWRGYLYDAKAFFEKRFGAENFISFAIHLDETTPHAHFVVVPILIKDGKRAYSSSEFIKNPEALARLHTDFWRAVGSKYGLERGVEGHAVTHSDAKDFRRKVALQKAKEIELAEKEKNLDAEREQIKTERISIKNEVARQVAAEKSVLQKQYSDAVAKYNEAIDTWAHYKPENLANYDRAVGFCNNTSAKGTLEQEFENRKLTGGVIEEMRNIIYALKRLQKLSNPQRSVSRNICEQER